MALIGTLRNKMGTWVVVFVFVAIAAFTVSDLFSNNSLLFNNNDVGEIAGHDVSLEEFNAAVQEREANYILNFGRQPQDREMPTLRQQAWEILVLRHAIQKQFDKLGVVATAEEIQDMTWGKNVDENIRQSFTDPATGRFDKSRLLSYLKTLNEQPEDQNLLPMWQEQRTRWEIFQRDMAPGRVRVKYENLLIKSEYITKAEAEHEYHMQSDVAELKYLYVPFFSVSDTTAKVSDAELSDYYNKNRERFRTEASRDVKYVVFDQAASSADSAKIREDLAGLASQLATATDDSLFAVTNSNSRNPFGSYTPGNLPKFLKPEDLQTGKVIGPFIDEGAYKVVKISSVGKDTAFSARASHILIKWDDESAEAKAAAKEKARGILKEIKNGASFAQKALEHGTDGTRTTGGDLGWFSKTDMVKPFSDAVFAATKTGLLNDVVETQFGYHLIDVTATRQNTTYKLAILESEIAPSDATENSVYRNAETFAANIDGVAAFEERAKSMNLNVFEGKEVLAGERRVGTLNDAREVVRWLFNTAEEGAVSTVFDLEGQYVVAIMTGETEEGYKSLEQVKAEITPQVKKDVIGKIITEKLNGLKGSLEEIAAAYGNDAEVASVSDLKMSSNALGTKFEPKAIGVAFSLENGKRSTPVIGENGVIIFELQNKTIAPAVADYSMYKFPLQQNSQNRSSFSIVEAIKKDANIKDNRFKFY